MIKYIAFLSSLLLVSCTTTRPIAATYEEKAYYQPDPPITQSLFDDKTATISEENIQKILDGSYTLPQNLRVAMVNLKSGQTSRSYYWNDETYLKTQQTYLDLFTSNFEQSQRVQRVMTIPKMLLSDDLTFTRIREAAVRTQSDVVAIYSITSDLYSRSKLFSKADLKAFATTQLLVLDVRTGLIPFSTIVTREFQSQRQEEELNNAEAINRTKNEAVLLTIKEIGRQLKAFLAEQEQ